MKSSFEKVLFSTGTILVLVVVPHCIVEIISTYYYFQFFHKDHSGVTREKHLIKCPILSDTSAVFEFLFSSIVSPLVTIRFAFRNE